MPEPVYESVLTRASAERLRSLVAGLPRPVALAGGHAVKAAVEKRWRDAFGEAYFGSRDIDVIYHVDPDWSPSQLERSAAAGAPKRIEDLGYQPHAGFRYMLLLGENGEVLEKEPVMAIEDVTIHRLYIDPMVTHIHSDLEGIWHFIPIDEPLLAEVFEREEARRPLPGLGPDVYLPATPYLVATKLKSFPERTKDDKAVKDLCDLYALVEYGGASLDEIRTTVHRLLPDVPERIQKAMRSEHLPQALQHLGIPEADFAAVVGPIAVRRRPVGTP